MKPYVPDSLPLDNIDWASFIELIGKANFALASFDGLLKGVVNPSVLLSPLTTKEAVLSSKIEGTQATLQEVLSFEAEPGKETPRYNDIQEIINYRKALNHSVDSLKKRPMNLNAIKKVHAMLMDSVRGKNKNPGEFRKEQNWIGSYGSTIEQASFIPPDPLLLLENLDNWEKYWHYDDRDRIVQLAIIHAQFEIIHPFKDGNGRMGRIFIPLYLYEMGMLEKPVFYMSEYLESNRDKYYQSLRNISDSGDWNGWIEFFLKGFIAQAEANCEKARKIITLYNNMKKEVSGLSTTYSFQALDTLFKVPIFNSRNFVTISGIPKVSASRLLKQLAENKIIELIRAGKGSVPSLYVFPSLLSITEG